MYTDRQEYFNEKYRHRNYMVEFKNRKKERSFFVFSPPLKKSDVFPKASVFFLKHNADALEYQHDLERKFRNKYFANDGLYGAYKNPSWRKVKAYSYHADNLERNGFLHYGILRRNTSKFTMYAFANSPTNEYKYMFAITPENMYAIVYDRNRENIVDYGTVRRIDEIRVNRKFRNFVGFKF